MLFPAIQHRQIRSQNIQIKRKAQLRISNFDVKNLLLPVRAASSPRRHRIGREQTKVTLRISTLLLNIRGSYGSTSVNLPRIETSL
jgi:hypothetical protein